MDDSGIKSITTEEAQLLADLGVAVYIRVGLGRLHIWLPASTVLKLSSEYTYGIPKDDDY